MKRALVLLLLVACSKGSSSSSTSTSTAPSTAPSTSTSTSTSASGSASASASPAPKSNSWTGTYESTEGTLYVPEGKEFEGVKFRGQKSDDGLGKGEIKLEIDPKGNAIGTLEGPLGPAVVTGALRDGVFSATVYRKDARDQGFSGTLLGQASADAIEGTMNLSQGEARVIRAGKFVLKRK